MSEYRRDTSFHLLDFDTPEVAAGLKDFAAPYESVFKVFTGLFSIFNLRPVIPTDDKDASAIKEKVNNASLINKEFVEEVITLAMIQSMFLVRLLHKHLSDFNKFLKNVEKK